MWSCCSEWSPLTKSLVQGQWISVLIAGTGIFATILSNRNSNFPLLISSFNYLLLSSFLIRRRLLNLIAPSSTEEDVSTIFFSQKDQPIKEASERVSIWWYIFAAVLDVEANFLVIVAYNYTTITSVMLLDCFTIPCAMALSFFFLNYRYTWKHVGGIILCLSGLACILVNDSIAHSGNQPQGDAPLFGDILCLSGAVLYAVSNVVQEHIVKNHDREQFMGHLGIFGLLIASVQCMIVDLPNIQTAHFSADVVLSIVGFVGCLFFMYTNTSSFLEYGDATVFNLSLLTSDVYAVIFTFFFNGYLVNWLYFVAFGLVIAGLVLYHREATPRQLGEEDGFSCWARSRRYFCAKCCCDWCWKSSFSLLADVDDRSSLHSQSCLTGAGAGTGVGVGIASSQQSMNSSSIGGSLSDPSSGHNNLYHSIVVNPTQQKKTAPSPSSFGSGSIVGIDEEHSPTSTAGEEALSSSCS